MQSRGAAAPVPRLPDPDRLPPGQRAARPHGQVVDGQHEAQPQPVALGHVAGAKVRGRAADAVGGEAAHQVGDLAQGQGGQHAGGAARARHRQECGVHGADVGGTCAHEGRVGVSV